MNIPMFTYFDIYATNNQIDYPFAEINMFQKECIPNTTSEKKVVSTHPPLEEIKNNSTRSRNYNFTLQNSEYKRG